MAHQLSREDLALFAEQLASLVRTELPLAPAVREVARNIGRQQSRAALEALSAQLERGVKLSDALAAQPHNFPPLFVALVAAGEKSNTMSNVLDELARLAQAQFRFRRAVADSVAYPIFVTLFALGLVSVLLGVVAPQMTTIVREVTLEQEQTLGAAAGHAMPFIVKAGLMATEHLFQIMLGLGVLVVALLAALLMLRLVPKGRRILARTSFAVPLWGNFARNFAFSHWARLMGILLKHGLPLNQALTLTSGASPNVLVREATANAARSAADGQPLSTSLKAQPVFPQFLVWLISGGEEQKQLPDALLSVADIYQERAITATSFIERSLQPILIAFIGLLVGLAIVGILGPMSVLISGVGNSF